MLLRPAQNLRLPISLFCRTWCATSPGTCLIRGRAGGCRGVRCEDGGRDRTPSSRDRGLPRPAALGAFYSELLGLPITWQEDDFVESHRRLSESLVIDPRN